MPLPDDPYDFSDAPITSEDDFSNAPRAGTAPPPSLPSGPERELLNLFDSTGIVNASQWDPHGWRFFEEPASATVVAGAEQKPNLPAPRQQDQGPSLGDIYRQKMAEVSDDPTWMKKSGLSGVKVMSGTVAQILGSTVDAMGQEWDANASASMQWFGAMRNVGRSLANIGPGLAALPEALVRDPGGTLMAMLEFVPHQAITLYKAAMPANTPYEKAEKEAAWKQLYEDPLGPAFAALIAGSFAKMSVNVASKYKAAAKLVNLDESVARQLAELEKDAAHERLDAGMKARETPAQPPNVPTRSLTTSTEAPPTGPISDPSRLLPTPKGMGEGFTTKDVTRSRRIPEGQAVEGAFGGKEFSETAYPSGTVEIRPFEGQVPERSLGTAPPGNLMDILKVVGDEATKADVNSGRPPKPPRYQPFLRSGRFSESKILDDAAHEVPIMESASPTLEVPKVMDFSPTSKTTAKWTSAFGKKMKRWFSILETMTFRVDTQQAKALIRGHQDVARFKNRNVGVMSERLHELGLGLQSESIRAAIKRKIKGIGKMTVDEAMALPEVRNFFVKLGEDLRQKGAQVVDENLRTQYQTAIRPADVLSPKDKAATLKAQAELQARFGDGWRGDPNLAKGVRPFELSEEFLTTGPYRWKPDILKAIREDVGGIDQAAQEFAHKAAKGASGVSQKQWIEGTINRMIENEMQGFSDVTKRAIASLTNPTTGMFKTPGEALKFLSDESAAQLFRRQGVERPRLSKIFPEDFRVTNPATLFARYVNEAAQTMAEIDVFGPDRGVLVKMLDDIKAVSPRDYELMSDLSDAAMGVIDRTHPLSRAAFLAQKTYSQYIFGAKIGLGFAPIVQITQPAISFIPDAGYVRSLKGTFKAMNPEYRAYLRKQGVIGPSAFRRLMGTKGSGISRFIPTIPFFDFANKVLDYTAGATGEVFARDLYEIANRDIAKANPIAAKRIKWARGKLSERFGIDYSKPLGDADFIRMTQDYARFTQLHPDVTQEPRYFNMPQTRWLAMLKRFTYRQAITSSKIIFGELKKGNMFPAMRAASAGLLGGDLMMYIRRKSLDFVSGKPSINPEGDFVTDDVLRWMMGQEDFPLQEIANRYALIGTFGMISDIGWIDEDDPAKMLTGLADNLSFSLKPVAVSDAFNVGQKGYRRLGDIGKMAMGTKQQQKDMPASEVARRVAEDVFTMFGSLGYHVSGRLKSDGAELKANKRKYNDVLKQARRAFWDGDKDKAWALMKEWNDNAHYYPMELARGNKGLSHITNRLISDPKFKSQFQ